MPEDSTAVDQTKQDVEEVLGTANFEDVYNQQVEAAKAVAAKTEEKPKEVAAQATETPPAEAPAEAAKTAESEAAEVVADPDGELTPEQVREILGERSLKEVVKTWDDREKWEKTLKHRAQAVALFNKLTPEQIDLIAPQVLPYAYNQKEIPETPEAIIDDVMKQIDADLPKEIRTTFHHEDFDEEIEAVIGKENLTPVMKKVVGTVIKKALPELSVLRTTNHDLTEQLTTATQYTQSLEQENGKLIMSGFLSRHQDNVPRLVNDEESPIEAILRVAESGEDHPEYYKYERLKAAADLRKTRAEAGKVITFEAAYNQLYGDIEAKAKQADKVKEKVKEAQKTETGEAPGRAVPRSAEDIVSEKMPSSRRDAVEEAFR